MTTVLERAVGTEPARRRDDSLDGIRALAAIWVFLVHAGYSGLTIAPPINLKGAGRAGVLLFFFLSAFLLARPFFEDRRRIRSAKSWAIFFARRVFRILPLYWFVLVVELVLTIGIFRDKAEAQRFSLFIEHVTFQKGLSVFWSLIIEWRFYLVFPLIALFAGAFLWMRRGVVILGGLVVVWIGASAAGLLGSGLWATLWIDKHAPVFVCGVLAAAAMAREVTWGPRARLALEVAAWVLGIAGILLSLPSFSGWLDGIAPSQFAASSAEYERFWDLRIPWIGFLMAAFFFCYANGRGLMRRVLSSRPLVEVGKYAFGIYLIHEPILRALASSATVPREVRLLLIFAITVLVAGMLFWLIEDPLIRGGQRLTRRFFDLR